MVDVAWEPLFQEWRRSDGLDLSLEYVPLSAKEETHEFVRRAVVEVSQRQLSASSRTPDDFPVQADDAYRLALDEQRYLIRLEDILDEDALRAWVEDFATALQQRGLDGRIELSRQRRSARWDQAEMANTGPQLSALFAFELADPNASPFTWNVNDAATARIAEVAERLWFEGAETLLMEGPGQLRIRAGDAARLLRRQLPRTAGTTLAHVAIDPLRVSLMSFGGSGLACVRVIDPALSGPELLDRYAELMMDLADLCQQSFVQYTAMLTGAWDGLSYAGDVPAGEVRWTEFTPYASLLDRVVPGPRGAMILTSAHLERGRDLSQWTITPLGNDRHLLMANDLTSWFARPGASVSHYDQALAAFGDLTITRADLAPR